jgi:hypothetical protein
MCDGCSGLWMVVAADERNSEIIETMDSGLVASWYQMPVDVDGDLYGVVPHLFFDVGERLALLNEQTRERMPNVLAFMPM